MVRYTADPTSPVPNWLPDEPLQAFDVVCLLSVDNPNLKTPTGTLWDKLRPYVEGGGKLVIIPGERVSPEGYKAGGNLMPGAIGELIETDTMKPPPPPQTAPGWNGAREGTNGVTWVLDKAAVQHPMLRPFQEWQAMERRDVVYNPRVAWKYWKVTKDPAPEAAVVVYYNDAEKPEDRHPAVLERGIPDPAQPTKVKGRVLLLTTPMDTKPAAQAWNDYWGDFNNSWVVVFPTLVVRYLAGDTADANFNYPTGLMIPVPLPKGVLRPAEGAAATQQVTAIIDGPHLTSEEAEVKVDPKQTELRLGPPRTSLPGSYKVSSVDSAKWE
jgi:hypothetical protein